MKLFVDCDGTLVVWKKSDKGIELPIANEPLIRVIRTFVQRVPCVIVVWSGGGLDYAAGWAEKYLKPALAKENITILSAAKNITLPETDDLCIDDMIDIKVAGRVISPEKFIDYVAAEFA